MPASARGKKRPCQERRQHEIAQRGEVCLWGSCRAGHYTPYEREWKMAKCSLARRESHVVQLAIEGLSKQKGGVHSCIFVTASANIVCRRLTSTLLGYPLGKKPDT